MIHVVWNDADCTQIRLEGRACYTESLSDLLLDLGVSFKKWSMDAWIESRPAGLTLLAGVGTDPNWLDICRSYCEAGNTLVSIGDLYGLGELFGVTSVDATHDTTEGWVEWEDAPIAAGLRSSFHFFGSATIKPITGDSYGDLETWGKLVRGNGIVRDFSAIASKSIGNGKAVLIAVDLMKTFTLIRQGISVVRDGRPAPDGTGAINENILKTDDASVLDWERDRAAVAEGEVPFYLHPIVDEWRILLMRLLYRLTAEAGLPMGQLWYWPNGLPAIGHISHDTDRNIIAEAHVTLDRLAEANVKSTWCIIMPGYDEETNQRIVGEGHEVALHYNALGTEIPEASWNETHFRKQFDMLQEQFPDQRIVSNKNHYLRWEGDIQFLEWCERKGILMEQSKGGTKQGNKGFLAGTCHPFLSFDPATGHEATSVVSSPTLSWDPPYRLRCTEQEALALTDRSFDVYGVAHFLFHPYMVADPQAPVGEMMVKLIQYGRSLGMEWWTGEQLLRWFEVRRQVRVTWEANSQEGQTCVVEGRISSPTELRGITLLSAAPSDGDGKRDTVYCVEADNEADVLSVKEVERYGCPFVEIQLNVQAGDTAVTLRCEAMNVQR